MKIDNAGQHIYDRKSTFKAYCNSTKQGRSKPTSLIGREDFTRAIRPSLGKRLDPKNSIVMIKRLHDTGSFGWLFLEVEFSRVRESQSQTQISVTTVIQLIA